LTLTNDLEKILVSIYNSSYGGKYELAGRIDNMELLTQSGYVTYSKCKDDPLSAHGAKSCRVLLVRMTEKGSTEAKKLIDKKMHQTGNVLKSLEAYPSRIRNMYRLILKKWLIACETGRNFHWIINTPLIYLPDEARETITKLTSDLVDKDMAANATINHTTSGPSDSTLMTCPEISQWLFDGVHWLPGTAERAKGVRTAVLDEYLKYLRNGHRLYRAKDQLLFKLNARKKIDVSTLRYVARSGGVPAESLIDWLEELASCGYIRKFNRYAKITPRQDGYSPDADIIAFGEPKYHIYSPRDDRQHYQSEEKKNIERWFVSGEETFLHFKFKTIR